MSEQEYGEQAEAMIADLRARVSHYEAPTNRGTGATAQGIKDSAYAVRELRTPPPTEDRA